MGTTPISSTAFLQGLQKGGKSFTSLRAKADVRELAKTNPLAKRMLYGGELSQRQMVRMGKELQKDTHTFTQRSARTVYNKLAREAMAQERLAQVKGEQTEHAVLQKKEDDANRKQAAYVRAKELEAEGKRAALKDRPSAVVSAGQTQSANATESAAEPPQAIDMPID